MPDSLSVPLSFGCTSAGQPGTPVFEGSALPSTAALKLLSRLECWGKSPPARPSPSRCTPFHQSAGPGRLAEERKPAEDRAATCLDPQIDIEGCSSLIGYLVESSQDVGDEAPRSAVPVKYFEP